MCLPQGDSVSAGDLNQSGGPKTYADKFIPQIMLNALFCQLTIDGMDCLCYL